MSVKVLDRLKERFGPAIVETKSLHGDEIAVVDPAQIVAVLSFLKDDPEMAFDYPTDMTAVDWLGAQEAFDGDYRFECVYHLYSLRHRHRIRIKARLPEENPQLESSVALYPAWNWFEREVWDMFGIRFLNHPDLRRLFMWEEFQGYPLRKDYPKEKRQPLARREGIV
jgi:NADH-quinone oxidoreductase subunit C